MRYAYRIFEKQSCERCYLEYQRQEGGRIKFDQQEIRCENVTWRDFTQDNVEMWALIFEILNLKCVLQKSWVCN